LKPFYEELTQHIAVMNLAQSCAESVEFSANLLQKTFESGSKVLATVEVQPMHNILPLNLWCVIS